MIEKLYISNAEIVSNTFKQLRIMTLDELEQIINTIINGAISSCVLYGNDDTISINIFSEGGKFTIGIIDEEQGINYYYTDGTNNINLVEINGNYFDANMICCNSRILHDIILEFAKTGKLFTAVKWLKEEQ